MICGAQELIDDVPLYVNAKEVCREDGSVEALELNYLTFYAHNGSCAPGSTAARGRTREPRCV